MLARSANEGEAKVAMSWYEWPLQHRSASFSPLFPGQPVDHRLGNKECTHVAKLLVVTITMCVELLKMIGFEHSVFIPMIT